MTADNVPESGGKDPQSEGGQVDQSETWLTVSDIQNESSRNALEFQVSEYLRVALFNYTRACFCDEPRNFEPWSSDVDDTRADTSFPNYYTTPTGGREFELSTDSTGIAPLPGGSSAVLGSNSRHAAY
ncbi:hypothetical protein TNCV_1598491 [Trichonephila clavipes]|nr:hypothetical protein TNCV_1598491 [Trichonephila clavipes]